MGWLRVESSFAQHRKIMNAAEQLGPGYISRVIGIWMLGACHAVGHLTDGFVPRSILENTSYDRKAKHIISAMVSAGLLRGVEGGYQYHDFHDYNPSAAELKLKLDWDAKRKRLYAMPGLIEAIRQRDQDHCRYCGRLVDWKNRRGDAGGTYDHVQPRGDNSLENVVVCCFYCNQSKGARTPEQAGMVLRDPDLIGTSSKPDPHVIGSSQNQVGQSGVSRPPTRAGARDPNPNPIPIDQDPSLRVSSSDLNPNPLDKDQNQPAEIAGPRTSKAAR